MRVVCRECGATIGPGEVRFGQETPGTDGERRTRWRHLACAALHRPTELLRTLEIGGWRAVPHADHPVLLAMIHAARARQWRRAAEPADPRRHALSESSLAGIDLEELEMKVERGIEHKRLLARIQAHDREIVVPKFENIVGESPRMKEIFSTIEKVIEALAK